jgi:hypothetical protein
MIMALLLESHRAATTHSRVADRLDLNTNRRHFVFHLLAFGAISGGGGIGVGVVVIARRRS